MAFIHSPKMITNGLVMYLDAANSKSYPGSGTVITDLSGMGNNGTIINSVTFNTGSLGNLVFNGSSNFVNCGTSSTLNLLNSFTVALWMNMNITATNQYFVARWTYSTGNFRQWSLDNNTLANTISFRATTAGTDASATAISYTDASNSNNWMYVCGVWSGTAISLYKNGGLVAGPSNLASIVSTSGQVTFIASGDTNTGFGYPVGNIASVAIYDRGLSVNEIIQNFNATRSRFGV